MDVHGVESTFRHIYRSTPRRHLLTTGWSNFVNNKKLLTGDSCRLRARRGRQLAAAGQPFEVVHYPRASASEFCVRVDAVKESMLVPCAPACSSRWRLRRRTCRGSAGSWVPSLVSRRPIPHGGHIRPGDSFGITTNSKIGSPTPRSPSPEAKKGDDVKPPGIMFFGRAILTEEQMKSSNGSGVPTSPRATRSGSSEPDCDDEKASNMSDRSGSNVTNGCPAKKNSPSWRLWWSGEWRQFTI
ncbi:unnamed protein product [Miscanthus lutarioriparius]|uniref:TF-B3 domain-containing protein n=1 Tax=Miscanthus lutarioriparius TaxID=422564 RepID=A0A811PU59_9POAL|nr:unnamed protein product [Miscanthus lutarioriparius]